jgi:hypothetical protein
VDYAMGSHANDFAAEMKREFEMNFVGELKYFFRFTSQFEEAQSKYAKELVKRLGFVTTHKKKKKKKL